MAFDVRFSRWTECEGKRAYRSKTYAKRAARRMETEFGGLSRKRPYRCHWCGFIHLGSPPDRAAIPTELVDAEEDREHVA